MSHTTDERDRRTGRPTAGWKWASVIAKVFLVPCLMTTACATLEVKHADSPTADGLHFYRPAPYLAISPGQSGCTMAIEYLPDYSTDYVMISHAGIGTVAFNPTLDNAGNLTSLNATVDSKTNELVAALGTVVAAAAPFAAALARPGARPTASLHPGLYKLNLTSTECGGKDPSLKCLVPVVVNDAANCQSVSPPGP